MAMRLLSSLILVSLFPPFSSSTLSPSLSKATHVLSKAGYQSVALTLQLISKPLDLESPTATIFAPSDLAFAYMGQPSLLQLQYHISPKRLSRNYLKILPSNAAIPTLASSVSLIITSSLISQGYLAINNVGVHQKPIFDDGSVIIYGMDKFFNPPCQIGFGLAPKLDLNSTHSGNKSDSSVSDFLNSKGYSIMGSFLDAQLAKFKDDTKLTIFAPTDEAIQEYTKNVGVTSLLFRRHIVPTFLPWESLLQLDKHILLTFSEGFSINVTVSHDTCMLNGVQARFPDLYSGDRIVVHGLNQLLIPLQGEEIVEHNSSELDEDGDNNLRDYNGYH